MVTEPSRRIVLATAGTVAAVAAGSAGLAGCKGIAALGPVPGVPPDVVTLDHAIAAERAIVASYAVALGKLTTITAQNTQNSSAALLRTVAGIQAEHRAHMRALRGRLVLPPGVPRFAKSRLGEGRQPLPPMPDSESGVLGVLAAAERAAAARLTNQLLDVPPALAQLMASIAASEAAHVVFLRRAGRL